MKQKVFFFSFILVILTSYIYLFKCEIPDRFHHHKFNNNCQSQTKKNYNETVIQKIPNHGKKLNFPSVISRLFSYHLNLSFEDRVFQPHCVG